MKAEPLDEAEIERRLPIWSILSDTFLDTELREEDYDRMAERLLETPYSHDEIEWMYRREVAPAFWINLMSVAGEWAFWPDDFIRERVLEKRTSKWEYRMTRLFMGRDIDEVWDILSDKLVALRRTTT